MKSTMIHNFGVVLGTKKNNWESNQLDHLGSLEEIS